jgi:molybdenum cofactor cytidylyltransferase
MKNTGAIILAAGPSKRLGRLKQLLSFRGQTLVRRAVASAYEAGCAPIIIVIGAEAEQLRRELADWSRSLVHNPRWSDGMGSSIRMGVAAAQQHNHLLALLVILTCDQPFLNADVIRALLELRARENKAMAACAYADTVGIPAVFDRAHFAALLHLRDEDGARSVLFSASEAVAQFPWPEGAIDIDTPEDYEKLIAREGAPQS